MSNDRIPAVDLPSGLLATADVALQLGISQRVVREKIDTGKLATVTLPGGHKRLCVRQKDLERFARRFGYTLRAGD